MINRPIDTTIVDEVFERLCNKYSHNLTLCAAFEMFRNEVHFTKHNNYLKVMERINIKNGMEMLKHGTDNI